MIKVFISAGHGGRDSGAVGNGLLEKDINLSISKACASYLDSCGLLVKLSRDKDENDPIGEEVNEANAFNADIAISFHNNAGGGNGSETWYYTHCQTSKKLAEYMETASKQLGQNSRGVKPTTSLYFLSKTKMPAVLVETAFIDNSDDICIIDNEDKQRNFGVAYARAILNFIAEQFDIPQPTPNLPKEEFLIKVKVPLNIRKGAGIEYDIVGVINDNYKYTIIDTASANDGGRWGKLKSGIGWINISDKFVTRC